MGTLLENLKKPRGAPFVVYLLNLSKQFCPNLSKRGTTANRKENGQMRSVKRDYLTFHHWNPSTVHLGGSGAHELPQFVGRAYAWSFERRATFEAADPERVRGSQHQEMARNPPQDFDVNPFIGSFVPCYPNVSL